MEFNFIELPKFTKTENELETVADKWIYFIQQAIKLDHIPENTDTPALKLAYEVAAQHQWSASELEIYEAQEMEICRSKNVIETARMDGIEQGKLEEKKLIAKGMLAKNIDLETITELTGLTIEAVDELRNNV